MRLLVLSSSSLGLQCLERLQLNSEVKIVGIITTPQTFSISYAPGGVKNVLHVDFDEFASRHQVPLKRMNSKMSDPDNLEFVVAQNPDCILVLGWYHMIPKTWLEAWPTFGIHASLLPKYSGGAPLVWAIINGEKITGLTLFRFDSGVDSGPIVKQRMIRIRRRDTIATVYKKVEVKSVRLIEKYVLKLTDPKLRLKFQNEIERSVFPQRSPDDGEIKETLDKTAVLNFIRAQTRPYPGAFAQIGAIRVVMWSLNRREKRQRASKGLISLDRQGVFISTLSGCLEILDFELQEKKDGVWKAINLDRDSLIRRISQEIILLDSTKDMNHVAPFTDKIINRG